ncbi:hypothetical protein [Mycobacterium sp. URHB0021]
MDALAAAAGVTSGALYSNFPEPGGPAGGGHRRMRWRALPRPDRIRDTPATSRTARESSRRLPQRPPQRRPRRGAVRCPP